MTINIDWPTNIITESEENKIIKKYIKKGYFGKLKDKNKNIDPIIFSFRKNYLRDLLIKNNFKIMRKIKQINKDIFKHGILKVSENYNFPPVAIFRLIMKYNNYNKKKISDILKRKKQHKNKFIQEQIEIALENDITADIDQSYQKESSLEFEDIVCKEFDKYNVKYMTEEQIRSEKSESGEKFLTPDMLLKKPIKINGEYVYWVDAKDFYGANLKTVKYRLKKQSQKYIKVFGNGAFVFRYGVSKNLKIDDTLLLSL